MRRRLNGLLQSLNCLDTFAARRRSAPIGFKVQPPVARHFRHQPAQCNSVPLSTRNLEAEAVISNSKSRHQVYIAIGSNVGERLAFLDQACASMPSRGIDIIRTSCLYETEPMYVLEQNRFLNGVCEVETDLSPHKLLNELKAIEKHLGRQKIVDKGPRNIDLDVLLYDSRVLDDSPTLSVPHKFMLEREFVLRPLCDLIPTAVPPLPDSQLSTSKGKTYQGYLSQLPVSSVPLSSLTPIPPSITLSASSPSRTTHVMGIINVTPDSFSDGGLHSVENLSFIAKTASDFTSQGATILDVGGQSTRPGATPISAEEELARVIPVIQTLRKLPSAANISLSIDTYRASVARVALDAGADMINDVTGGRGDSNMLGTAATRHVPIILTHSRGTPETMSQLATYPEGMIETVGRELAERVKEAERAGVRRWHIILDPGLGFAKGQKQNLELLRDFDRLRSTPALRGLPWLVGPSRKGFIGRITGVEEPSRRGWGTAATITAAVQGGADIVRVHDVKEMVQVAKMADAIWRC